MTIEFTGERVVPGAVDVDLWNEHFARYAFASRLVDGLSVLDLACGTGYGTAELATRAARVVGVDIAVDALHSALAGYSSPNVSWTQASGTELPFATSTFDVVVAFEVIEHLVHQKELLQETKRVLRPNGCLIVSTPNRSFYAAARADSGPNPFHQYEFDQAEFNDALRRVFASVELYTQDHSNGVLIRHLEGNNPVDVRVESAGGNTSDANFFLAICSHVPHVPASSFFFLPRAANVLNERRTHIQLLESELKTKDLWLTEARHEHRSLVETFRQQTSELEQSNRWADDLNRQTDARGTRIQELQTELADITSAYELQLQELHRELTARTQWAQQQAVELQQQTAELGHCVKLLHQAEDTVEERTRWAMQMDAERESLAQKLAMARASRWLRLGRKVGLGPELRTP